MYRRGQDVRIVACTHTHGFTIGEIVNIDCVNRSGNYTASSSRGVWDVETEEIEKL